jgi:SAM-dependent methyltransferase
VSPPPRGVAPGLGELYAAFDSPPHSIVAFLQHLVEACELPQPLRVLDVGCGPGRLLGPLDRLRWEVTGIEPNPEFAAAAREVARTSRRLSVREGGFLDVDDREAFDLVCAINSSFAHLLTAGERRDAVLRMHEALRTGGLLFLDVPNFPWVLKHFRAPEPDPSVVQGREVTLHRRHEIDYHDALFTTSDEYVFADGADANVRLVHRYAMVTYPELEFHLREAGFVDLLTFNDFDSRAPERIRGGRILVAARRPAED